MDLVLVVGPRFCRLISFFVDPVSQSLWKQYVCESAQKDNGSPEWNLNYSHQMSKDFIGMNIRDKHAL